MIITERKAIAQALNFGKYPVLMYDLDNNKGSKAKVIKESARYGKMEYKCTLYRGYQKADDGIFYLMTRASMLTATVDVRDWMECAEYSNAPIIDAETEVAILLYSKSLNHAHVEIVKSGKVDPTYSTSTIFSVV